MSRERVLVLLLLAAGVAIITPPTVEALVKTAPGSPWGGLAGGIVGVLLSVEAALLPVAALVMFLGVDKDETSVAIAAAAVLFLLVVSFAYTVTALDVGKAGQATAHGLTANATQVRPDKTVTVTATVTCPVYCCPCCAGMCCGCPAPTYGTACPGPAACR